MAEPTVSEVVIDRLPLYLRLLQFLEKEGKQVTSSQELAERLGFSSAQIRKDLSYFGEFGKQGMGYNVGFLQKQLRRILHVDQTRDIALIGVGDLGHALANYQGFLDHSRRDPELSGDRCSIVYCFILYFCISLPIQYISVVRSPLFFI